MCTPYKLDLLKGGQALKGEKNREEKGTGRDAGLWWGGGQSFTSGEKGGLVQEKVKKGDGHFLDSPSFVQKFRTGEGGYRGEKKGSGEKGSGPTDRVYP